MAIVLEHPNCQTQAIVAEWYEEVDSGRKWNQYKKPVADLWPDDEVQICDSRPQKTLAEKFREQADKWAYETGHMSSPTQRILHPSYQAILGMGRENKREITRLLLEDLRQNRRQWFWALSYIAQDNPIRPEDAGRLDKMIDAWVKWGTTQGLL